MYRSGSSCSKRQTADSGLKAIGHFFSAALNRNGMTVLRAIEPEQEVAVERVEFVLPAFGLDAMEPVAQVVVIAVEEAFLLNEVNKHQAVEHQRRVPLGIGHAADALDELQEGLVFGLEAVVE